MTAFLTLPLIDQAIALWVLALALFFAAGAVLRRG